MGIRPQSRLVVRFVASLLLIATVPSLLRTRISRVHADGPEIVASPTSNLPHAVESVTGTGFQPLASVAFSMTSSSGSSPLGSLTADGSGAVAGLLRLPFALDAGIANTLTAMQAGTVGTASTQIVGVGVIPSISAAQQLSGHVGDTVSVHVLGFAPQDPLTITVGGTPVATAPGNAGFVAGDTGTLDLSFVIPAPAEPGNDVLVIAGAATGQGQNDSASVPIHVVGLQNLIVSPNPARAGGSVEIRAGGFGSNERIDISFSYHDSISNGATIANASGSADAAGNLDVAFTLPLSAAAGSASTLTAHGESTGLTLSQAVSVLGRPSIALTPPGAEPGAPITLSGTGFQPGERVFLNSALFRMASSGLIADATGIFTGTFTVRALTAPGFYNVGASGINGSRAFARFTVPKAPTPSVRVSPVTATPGDDLRVQGEKFLASEPVALSLNAVALAPADGPITATLTGAFNTTVQLPKVSQSGVYAVTAEGLLTGSRGSSNVRVVLPPVSKTFFAEGYTGNGPSTRFGESLDVLNTSPMTAEGRIQYFLGTGMTSTVTIAIPPRSRLTEDVAKDVGPNQTVSAVVELDQQAAVTRAITRATATGAPLASSMGNGDSDLSQFWYFAEGYTGASFQEYLSLFNPGNVAAQLMVQTFSPVGTAPIAPFRQTVPAHTRITVNLRSIVPNRSIGLLVQSDQPIAAERVLYWGAGSGSGKYGASVSAGIRGPAAVWTFPYASTVNGDQVFLSFANPTTVAAHVQFTLFGDHGSLAPLPSMTIPPGARATLTVPSQLSTAAKPMAIVARSDVPVVGEQAQYFGGSPNIGSHTGSIVAGTPMPSLGLAFAGFSGKQFASVDWYVLNTGSMTANLTGTLIDPSNQSTTFQRTAAPGRLTRINLGAASSAATNSSMLWSSDAAVSIVEVLHGSDTNNGAVLTGVISSGTPSVPAP